MTLIVRVLLIGVIAVSSGCSVPSTKNCQNVTASEVANELIEVVRPYEEFKRDSDGFHYTMEIHLERFDLEIYECPRSYLAILSPKK